jgi:hypothetical protein
MISLQCSHGMASWEISQATLLGVRCSHSVQATAKMTELAIPMTDSPHFSLNVPR